MRRKNPGRFIISAAFAMAAVMPLGLGAQHWMTYELLGVDGGFEAWCLATVMLFIIGLGTALLIGLPCYQVTRAFRLAGAKDMLAFCGLATVTTAVVHRLVVPFATTFVDHVVPPVLGLVFFAVFHASYYGRARTDER